MAERPGALLLGELLDILGGAFGQGRDALHPGPFQTLLPQGCLLWRLSCILYNKTEATSPSVSMQDWFQIPLQIPKSQDAQVPYVNGVEFAQNLHTCPLVL